MPYLGKSPLHGNYSKLDDFSGDFDGSDATHALATNGLAVTPVTEAALLISINGVLQEPTTAYTVSGTNITFTSAPASTDTFYGVALGEQLAIGTPSDATVTPAKMNITSALLPASADGAALGSTSKEWSDLYLADSSVIYFGNDQDVTVTHDPDDGLIVKSIATADNNPLVLTLQTGETTMVADEPIAQIHFQAPDESSGTDSILIAATIQATAEGAFSSSSNATSLDFMTASSEAATKKWSINSDGKFEAAGAYKIDMNAGELILDADADTSITADTDDTIDIRIAGADDFQFSANSFNVLSGSTLTIDSGATITNSGTATNFGSDMESAYTGVLETNANFVDQVIFGPAVDGKTWSGAWSKASVFSSLMLATLEDPGSAAQVNIWDLTEQTSGTISTTPLATVNISGAATPTSIAAAMGYIIVGHEDGITIIDPHGGSWAARTTGWPRTLSTSTAPALDSNDVVMVAAGVAGISPYDPRTGGYIPCFGVLYAVDESNSASLIKYDGNVWDITGTATTGVVGFQDDDFIFPRDATDTRRFEVELITANMANSGGDSYWDSDAWPQAFAATTAFSAAGIHSAAASTSGAVIRLEGDNKYATGLASINRTYNTGFLVGNIRGAWLANSPTADRSYKAQTLTANGSVTSAVVETSAELLGYSSFTTSNFFHRNSDAAFDVITTGSAYWSAWFKATANSAHEFMASIMKSGGAIEFAIRLDNDGKVTGRDDGATAQVDTTSTAAYDDSVWHKIDFFRVSSTERYLYVDGVLVASNTTDAGSLSDDGNLELTVGSSRGGAEPFLHGTLSLVRLSTTYPSPGQVRQMYEAEKGMFVASAECLLQSGSTDAVLDVDVDPLTSKVIVTQTDAITIFDGLVVDSKPTVNSGASEKGKLWGNLRAEQNAANAYVTAPAVDQRQVNELVRGLASDLPAGPDLGTAKAWAIYNSADVAIKASYNVKSVVDRGVGQHTVNFGIPFKGGKVHPNTTYICVGNCEYATGKAETITFSNADGHTNASAFVYVTDRTDATVDPGLVYVAFFGELENE